MIRYLQTFLLVVLLTGMIWAWAEQSQTRPLPKQIIELDVDVPVGTGFAIYHEKGAMPWSHRIRLKVTAEFNGQQGGISKLAQLIARGEFPAPYSVPIDQRVRQSPDDQQTVELNLNKALSNDPWLEKLHVVVTSVTPATAEIIVDRLKETDLELVARFSDGFDRAVEFKDSKVKVLLPAGLRDKLSKANAKLPADVQQSADDSKPLPAKVARQIDGYPIRPNPEETTVTLASRETAKMKDFTVPVPLKVFFNRDFPYADYVLDIPKDQWLKIIVVTGPADRPPEEVAKAITMSVEFNIKDDWKETEPYQSKEVRIDCPKDFTVVSPDKNSADRSIKFRFVKRKEGPGG